MATLVGTIQFSQGRDPHTLCSPGVSRQLVNAAVSSLFLPALVLGHLNRDRDKLSAHEPQGGRQNAGGSEGTKQEQVACHQYHTDHVQLSDRLWRLF